MSTTNETRTIQRSVSVTRCDGPGCTAEHVNTDRFDVATVPAKWFKLNQVQPDTVFDHGERVGQPGNLANEVVFHRWACLVAWVNHHQLDPNQVNVPVVDPAKALAQ